MLCIYDSPPIQLCCESQCPWKYCNFSKKEVILLTYIAYILVTIMNLFFCLSLALKHRFVALKMYSTLVVIFTFAAAASGFQQPLPAMLLQATIERNSELVL